LQVAKIIASFGRRLYFDISSGTSVKVLKLPFMKEKSVSIEVRFSFAENISKICRFSFKVLGEAPPLNPKTK